MHGNTGIVKGDNRSGANYAIAHAIETALEQIIEYNRAEKKPTDSSILLLGRFGFDGDRLEKTGLFEYITRDSRIRSVKYPKLNITFMTAHSSKGLGYDNVIVVNGRNETYGFPSKIEMIRCCHLLSSKTYLLSTRKSVGFSMSL